MSSPVPPEPSPITPLPEEENIQASKGMWRREGGRGEREGVRRGRKGGEEREGGGSGGSEGLGLYSTLSHL